MIDQLVSELHIRPYEGSMAYGNIKNLFENEISPVCGFSLPVSDSSARWDSKQCTERWYYVGAIIARSSPIIESHLKFLQRGVGDDLIIPGETPLIEISWSFVHDAGRTNLATLYWQN